jgi:ribosomal protein L25 (general stress protein Ctc)
MNKKRIPGDVYFYLREAQQLEIHRNVFIKTTATATAAAVATPTRALH